MRRSWCHRWRPQRLHGRCPWHTYFIIQGEHGGCPVAGTTDLWWNKVLADKGNNCYSMSISGTLQNQLDASCRSKSKDVRSKVMSVEFLRKAELHAPSPTDAGYWVHALKKCPPAMKDGNGQSMEPLCFFWHFNMFHYRVIQLEGLMPTMFCRWRAKNLWHFGIPTFPHWEPTHFEDIHSFPKVWVPCSRLASNQ